MLNSKPVWVHFESYSQQGTDFHRSRSQGSILIYYYNMKVVLFKLKLITFVTFISTLVRLMSITSRRQGKGHILNFLFSYSTYVWIYWHFMMWDIHVSLTFLVFTQFILRCFCDSEPFFLYVLKVCAWSDWQNICMDSLHKSHYSIYAKIVMILN